MSLVFAKVSATATGKKYLGLQTNSSWTAGDSKYSSKGPASWVSHTALPPLLYSFWAHLPTWGFGDFLSHPVSQGAQKSPRSRWGWFPGGENGLRLPKEARLGERRAGMIGSIERMMSPLPGVKERLYVNTVKNTSSCSKPEHDQKEDNEEYFPSKIRKGKMEQNQNKTKKHKTSL